MIFGDVKRVWQALMASEMPVFARFSASCLKGVAPPSSAPASAPPGNAARMGLRRSAATPAPCDIPVRPACPVRGRAGQGGSDKA